MNAAKAPIDESVPFYIETDASDDAISGILSQRGRPVALFSRSLLAREKNLELGPLKVRNLVILVHFVV